MKITYSWVDSPSPIDVIGNELWELVKITAKDEAILGIVDEEDEIYKLNYIDNLKKDLKCKGHLLIGRFEGNIFLTCLLCQQSLQTTSHLAELKKGTIDPSFREKGYLKDAFRNIVEKSKKLGVSRLTLDVRDESIAHKIWSHWGFESFGVLDDYARHNGNSYRGHFMHQSVGDLKNRLSYSRRI